MAKCLSERQAQHIVTAASGREALALVLSDSESYLHFEHCIWMTSIEPSRLWDSETRAGYCEIQIQILAVDVMAGGGGGAGPAVDPTSSVRYTGRIMHNVNIDTNISSVKHPVSGDCTLAV